MSESGFYLLPTNKLYKKENTRRLKNFPAGYVGSFYRNLADNADNGSDFFWRITEMLIFLEKMSKNTFWLRLILQRVFKPTLTIMSLEIG